MLHAFLQKNVRRVLAQPRRDHAIAKNEDGVTSMVFSPLVFMPPASAVAVLVEIMGDELVVAMAGREPRACALMFWPSLRAPDQGGVAASRCEPDFTAIIDFNVGASVLIVAEMKWDWRVATEQLQQQIDRQLGAIMNEHPGAVVEVLTITKHQPTPPLTGATQRSWIDVHRAASALAHRVPDAPEGRWGALVAAFLSRAEQMSFQGFSGSREAPSSPQPVFWSRAA